MKQTLTLTPEEILALLSATESSKLHGFKGETLAAARRKLDEAFRLWGNKQGEGVLEEGPLADTDVLIRILYGVAGIYGTVSLAMAAQYAASWKGVLDLHSECLDNFKEALKEALAEFSMDVATGGRS